MDPQLKLAVRFLRRLLDGGELDEPTIVGETLAQRIRPYVLRRAADWLRGRRMGTAR